MFTVPHIWSLVEHFLHAYNCMLTVMALEFSPIHVVQRIFIVVMYTTNPFTRMFLISHIQSAFHFFSGSNICIDKYHNFYQQNQCHSYQNCSQDNEKCGEENPD